ncbi:unnamed protein product [Mycena citricolor]|uniref:CNNM transmembrane domain-containing protein n=1 Tax=Mycena citricolor TaxID=2018698 RepID=A0AAD2GZL1_9AGAR|nr:unnamed protein product [Mycena citricolor]
MRARTTHLLLPLFLRALSALATPISSALAAKEKKTHTHPERWSPEFWEKISISAVLVLLGGVFAGLTLGLMGLDELHLKVLAAASDDEDEKRNAKKVLKLMQKGRHWVLVVLLLGNVIINESLPIFLDSAIGGGIAAVAISTAMIVIFGIIPQAVSVRYGLAIGAACAPFVLGLMYVFAPIAWPIAKLLDTVLGVHETHTYKKAELRTFLQFHRSGDEPLQEDEISILNGVLELSTKKVERIMTPMTDVVTLSADALLDDKLVENILLSGYSRFPVHEPGKPEAFVGLLLIKKLLKYDPSQALPVSSFPLSILPEARPTISCFQALDYLYGFILDAFSIVLLNQAQPDWTGASSAYIIEEIISEEIVDETDRYADNVSKQRAKRATTADVMRGIVERRRGVSVARSLRSDLDENEHGGGESAPRSLPDERSPLIDLSTSPRPRRPAALTPVVENGKGYGSTE